MNKDVEILKKVAAEFNGKFQSNYSGRGMFGESCCGVIVSANPLEICIRLGQAGFSSDFDPKMDNMGLKYIIYFPRLQSNESEEPEIDDDDDDDDNTCHNCPDCGSSGFNCMSGECAMCP